MEEKLQVLSRWVGPPHSPIQCFRVESMHVDYAIYGTSSGRVVLKHFQSNDGGLEVGHEAMPMQHKFATCLVASIPQLPGEDVGPITRVAWGGGTRSLVAAVEGSCIHIFSLKRYFDAVANGAPHFSATGETDWISEPCQHLAVLHMEAPVVALDWTQAVDGLVASDRSGIVHAWRLLGEALYTPGSPAPKGLQPLDIANDELVAETLWHADMGQAQTLIAAGVHASAPCATAVCGESKVATVVWPQDSQAEGEDSVRSGSLRPSRGVETGVTLRFEELRHPAPVVSLAWSPGSLEIIAPPNDQMISDGLPAVQMASHPALMTVCADRVIRIWVEVVGLVPPGIGGVAATGELGTSHLCVTLVIQQPGVPTQHGRLRAAWGRPLHAGAIATPSVTGTRQPLSKADNVLWIVGVLDQQEGKQDWSNNSGTSPDMQMAMRDEVYLWAVDGLMGLVMNGIPNNMGGSRTMRTPRAVLWGQYHGPLTWAQPAASQHVDLACDVLFEDEVPTMQVYETVAGAAWEASELRVYRVPTVDASGMHRAGVHPGAQLGRHVRGLMHVSLLGHSSPVSSVQIHPGLGAAASLDRDGGLVVWLVDPLTPVFGLRGNAHPFTTAAWVPTPPSFLPPLPSMMGDHPQALLAAATENDLLLSSVCLSPHCPSATRVAELPMQTSLGRLVALCVKDHPPTHSFQATSSRLARFLLGCAASATGSHVWMLWRLDIQASPSESADTPDSPVSPKNAATPISATAVSLGHCPTAPNRPPVLGVVPIAEAGADMATSHADGSIALWRCALPQDVSEEWSVQVAAVLTMPFGRLQWAAPPQGAPITAVCSFAALAVSAGGGRVAAALRSTGLDEGAVVIWQAERSGVSEVGEGFRVEGVLELDDVPSGLAWMDVPATSPVLAVSSMYEGVALFSRAHADEGDDHHFADTPWVIICRCGTHHQPVAALSWSCTAGPVVAAGNELLALSNSLQAADTTSATSVSQSSLKHGPLSPLKVDNAALGRKGGASYSTSTIQALARRAGGPLPDFHPRVLRALLARGNFRAAVAAVRALLDWARENGEKLTKAQRASSLPAARLKALMADSHVSCMSSYLSSSEARIGPARTTGGLSGPTQSLSSLLGRPKPLQPSQPSHSAVASGQLDMSAFGRSGGGSNGPSHASSSQVDSGQLDMSAFGGFGGGSSAPLPAPSSQLESGQLDMSAFGGFGGGSSAPPPAPSSQLESGQLDMSAFGGFGGGSSAPPPVSSSQLESGQLDMSAFGGFGGGGNATAPAPSSQLESGQLDMSAFAGFGGGVTAPPTAVSSQFESGQLDMSAFGGFGGGSSDRPTNLVSQMETGQLDMSAYGGGGGGSNEGASGSNTGVVEATRQVNWAAFPGFYKTWTQQREESMEPLEPLQPDELTELQSALGLAVKRVEAASEKYGIKGESSGGGVASKEASAAKEAVSAALGLSVPEVGELGELARQLSDEGSLLPLACSSRISTSANDHQTEYRPKQQRHNLDLPGMRYSSLLILSCVHRTHGETVLGSAADQQQPSLLSSNSSTNLLGAPRLPSSSKPPSGSIDRLTASLGAASLQGTAARGLLPGGRGASSGGSTPGSVSTRLKSRSSGVRSRGRLASGLASHGSTTSVLSFSELSDSPAAAAIANSKAAWEQNAGLRPGLGLEAILWAMQSSSQRELVAAATSTTHHVQGEGGKAPPLTWAALRSVGAGFWLTEAEAQRATAEELAKAQFAATRDPHECALMYIALKKKATFQMLLRSSNLRTLADFMERDFSDPKHQAAAGKNAYVLLGKHRFELAAAMFILAGSTGEALAVCSNQLKDMQLGLFVIRLLDGNSGPLTVKYVEETVLPAASQAGDHWAEAALLWGIGRQQAAIRALLAGVAPGQAVGSGEQREGAVTRAAGDGVGVLEWVSFYGGHHCVGAAGLVDMARAALQAAYRLDVLGCTLSALHSLAQAEVLEAMAEEEEREGRAAEEGSLHRTVRESWRTRVVLGAAARAFLVSWSSASEDGADVCEAEPWRGISKQELASLEEAGLPKKAVRNLLTQLEMLERQQHAVHPPHPTVPSTTNLRRRSKRPGLLSPRHNADGQSKSDAASTHEGEADDLYTDCISMVQLEGDKVMAVAACRGERQLEADGRMHTFAAATSSDGIRIAALLRAGEETDEDEGELETDGADKASMFSGLMTDMLEHMRWPPDPWAVVSGEPEAQAGAGTPGRQAAAGVHGDEQTEKDHVEKAAQSVFVSAAQVNTTALDAHPSRGLFLSGSLSGHVFLWQYSQDMALSAFTPKARTAASHASSSTGHAAQGAHWGHALSVRFSGCGERFAAVGSGGIIATWRLDQGRPLSSTADLDADSSSLGSADWSHPCFSKGGTDVIYLGGSSSVFAAAGHCSHGSVRIWDTLSPLHSACVGHLDYHDTHGGSTCLTMLPGGLLLASGGETGHVAMHDLRMLGGSSGGRLLWHAKHGGPHGGHHGRVMCAGSGLRPGSLRSATASEAAMLATGGKDGTVRLWSGSTGKPLQVLEQAHFVQRRGATSYLLGRQHSTHKRSKPQSTTGVAVTGLQLTADGLLTCGADGAVRFRRVIV